MRDHEPLIIVVDPDADFATALSSLLDRRGYHVVRRSCGIDALEYIAEDRPELVLSDVDLPDCDCDELLDSIRSISPTTRSGRLTWCKTPNSQTASKDESG